MLTFRSVKDITVMFAQRLNPGNLLKAERSVYSEISFLSQILISGIFHLRDQMTVPSEALQADRIEGKYV
jgi:hypothetical protein